MHLYIIGGSEIFLRPKGGRQEILKSFWKYRKKYQKLSWVLLLVFTLFFGKAFAFHSPTEIARLEDELIKAMRIQEMELSTTDESYLRSLIRFFEKEGWPSAFQPIWTSHADTHGFNDTYREALRQGALMQKLVSHYHQRPITMKTLHIGDISDGATMSQVAETARLPEEFGVSQENRYLVPGNNEWGGFTSHDLFTQNEWRQHALMHMQENGTLVPSQRSTPERFVPLADNEIGILELWPGFKIAVSHKPLHELSNKTGWKGIKPFTYEDESSFRKDLAGINLRNWLGTLVTSTFAYLPAALSTLAIVPNFIPVKVNSKFLGPDIWRIFWSPVQTLFDLARLKTFKVDYQFPTFFRKSGPYFVFDKASVTERIHRRLIGNLPRWDSETLSTTRYETPIPADIQVVQHAHTHRGHISITGIQNELAENHLRVHVAPPPTYEDRNVPEPGRGWISYMEIDGVPMVAMHDQSKGGKIAFFQKVELENDPRVKSFYDRHEVDRDSGIVPRGPISCRRLVGRLSSGSPLSYRQGLFGKFKEFGQGLGTSPKP